MDPIRALNTSVLSVACLSALYIARRNIAFLALAAGWLANLVYLIFLEPKGVAASKLTLPLGTVAVGTLGSSLFLVSALMLGRRTRSSRALLLGAVAFLSTLGITAILYSIPAFQKLREAEFFVIVAGPHTILSLVALTALGHELQNGFAQTRPADIAFLTRVVTGVPLFVYAFMQVLYLARQFQSDPVLIRVLGGAFWAALVCKGMHAIGLIYIALGVDAKPRDDEDDQITQLTYLLGTIAHEMKAPLQSLRNYSFAAKKYAASAVGNEDQRMHDVVENMAEEALRIMRIHEEMTALSEPLSEEQLSPLAVASVLQGSWQEYRRAYQVKDIAASEHYAKGLMVRAHEGRLQQVFMNALRNAGESIHEARSLDPTTKGRIELRAERMYDKGKAICRVRIVDNGIGVSEAHRAKLFVPYFTTKRGVNRGLGMYVSRQLVNSMHGRIEIRDQRELGRKGAELVVDLPLYTQQVR